MEALGATNAKKQVWQRSGFAGGRDLQMIKFSIPLMSNEYSHLLLFSLKTDNLSVFTLNMFVCLYESRKEASMLRWSPIQSLPEWGLTEETLSLECHTIQSSALQYLQYHRAPWNTLPHRTRVSRLLCLNGSSAQIPNIYQKEQILPPWRKEI